MGDGAGKRMMECEVCTEMTRRAEAGKDSGNKGCRGAEHGQACTKACTGAVAIRAALEWAVQLGRGDEVNTQAEMANPTKCRDLLQTCFGKYSNAFLGKIETPR
jgi:hypothetical protein